ncbi:LamG-like jellyroll fold domain-containing protein [Sulfurimonas sp. HSL3-7]|uniref:LamG-like jellyroll fold domain-containing protein n=1 Tax=Sulfonitrofixus jiaomeiensis TaxID=3131938 RepID=UPI0031F8323B
MNVITIGSCLSDMTANRAVIRFGGKRLGNVVHHRSDQFYHYYVKADKKQIPRKCIEQSLNPIEINSDDPNYVSFEAMLNNQYEGIGQHRTVEKYDFFDVLQNEKVDVFILDNYVDMSGRLSYPKFEEYSESPVFLRKNDFENYDDFFTLGDKISLENSAFYFREIITFLKATQPTASIYFIHYPYNTYEKNPKRQERAKEFEALFKSNEATIIPAPFIKKQFQLENDPAHFHDSIYVALAGFIHFHYEIHSHQAEVQQLLKLGKKFNGPEDYFPIPEIAFNADDSWTAAIKIYEFENDQLFNFFFGQRGTRNKSIVRRKNRLEFRADDDQYVGSVEFLTKTLNEVVVVYDEGKFIFYNNGKSSDVIEHPTSAVFDAIGSGYNGKQHEQPCLIETAAIWKKALIPEEVAHCFDKSLMEKDNDLVGYWELGKEADFDEGKKDDT